MIKLDNETYILNPDDRNEKNIYIDIINIYDENQGKKIHETEKYLVNPNANAFQVFISCEQNDEKASVIQRDEKSKDTYFQKFVIPLMNFDVKTLNYEAKKIIIKPIEEDTDFKFTPTFLNTNYTNVSYLEINYENKDKMKINNNLQNGDLGIYSFEIKIKTFIDLYKKDD